MALAAEWKAIASEGSAPSPAPPLLNISLPHHHPSRCHPTPSAALPCLPQVEFILMGGTFMSLPTDYRDYFVRNLHDALSGHTSKDVAEAVR